ncbi:hypothetical protein ACLMJK_001901 [Lecanora helva]
MPGVDKFSNEIFMRIINFIPLWDGLEQVILCCRLFFQLGYTALMKHRRLKRRYGSLLFVRGVPKSPCMNRILCDLLEDGDIGPHVTKVHLAWYGDFGLNNFTHTHDFVRSHENGIHDLIDSCGYISSANKSGWKRDILIEETGASAALALTLLPNLKSITMEVMMDEPAPRLFEFLSTLQASYQVHPTGTHPLGRLQSVDLDHSGLTVHGEFSLFKYFGSIPSIESLSGELIIASPERSEWTMGHCKRLHELNIRRSCLNANALKIVLDATSNLQSFNFSFEAVGVFCLRPQALKQSILQVSKHSLVSLCLSADERNAMYGEFIGSLRGFDRLEYICLSCWMVTERPGAEGGYQYQSRTRRTIHYKEPANKQAVCPLVDTMPLSMRSLKLTGPCSVQNARGLLADLPETGQMTLPRLKTIKFEENSDKLLRICLYLSEKQLAAIGISLLVVDGK